MRVESHGVLRAKARSINSSEFGRETLNCRKKDFRLILAGVPFTPHKLKRIHTRLVEGPESGIADRRNHF